MEYVKLPKEQQKALYHQLKEQYLKEKSKGHKFSLVRGLPDSQMLDLASDILTVVDQGSTLDSEGFDTRQYGKLQGIEEARRLMAQILEVPVENTMVGGNSGLSLMHSCMSMAYIHGLVDSPQPWSKEQKVRILCHSPGYDRHFSTADFFGFELVPIPIGETGPNMDIVEQLVKDDPYVKAIFCVPKYSNPTGCVYSNDTVQRLANMPTAAKDFCIIWDNAYGLHDFDRNEPEILLSLYEQLEKAGNPNRGILFCSTSKISFAGGGIAAFASGLRQMEHINKYFYSNTICFDKVNQLRHARYFKDIKGIHAHMGKLMELIAPKFDAALTTLQTELGDTGTATWSTPKGGYFISLDSMEGCATKITQLAKDIGIDMLPPGSTFPYGKDPLDTNIRIAPTFLSVKEITQALQLLCLCVKLASLDKLLI